MKPLELAVIGAGGRGHSAYGSFVLNNPHTARYVAVAEPDDDRRKRLADAHNIDPKYQFKTWQELVDKKPPVEAVINCTQDAMHAESAVALLRTGYHQLLEKPMATTPHDCIRIVNEARNTGRVLAICHVLRYSPFFQAMKDVISSGRLGDIMTVEHKENVAFWHYAHSFVRGPWSRRAESSPMVLAKSCHDMDMLVYLIAKKPLRISSIGSLTYFRPENAPAGATDRCLDGCPAEPECPYSVQKNYLGGDRPGWIKDSAHLSLDKSYEGKLKALQTARYGLCVYKADNDVIDHQVAIIEFEGGVTVSFLMHAFSIENTRTMRYGLTRGEIKGHAGRNEIHVGHFFDGREETIKPGRIAGGHGGGDTAMMRQFIDAISSGDPSAIITNADESLESHLLAFAAEESRLNGGAVIDMAAYRKKIESETK